jgi:hypothetical protein
VPQPLEYSFHEQVELSHEQEAEIRAILLANIPGSRHAFPACRENDKRGTDWWVEMCGGFFLSIDLKIRKEDFAAKSDLTDDLALESWSVIEKRLIGWSRNPSKRSDYILWYWLDTRRWCLVPFPPLCRVFCDRWEGWKLTHKVAQQHTPDNGDYHSECIFVPRREVWAAIYSTFSGQTK